MEVCFSYKTPLLCNQECFFCVTNAAYTSKIYNISIEKVIWDFLELKKQWYNFISIEWGEPTMVGNLDKIIKAGDKMWFTMTIITNWINCSKEYLENLYSAGLRKITFSLHSIEEKTHNYLVQKEWSYQKIIQAIEDALDIGFQTSTNTVICKQNQEYIADMIDYINNKFPKIDRISFCNIEANQERKEDYENKWFMFSDLDIVKQSIQKIKYDNVIIDNLPLCAFGENKLHLAIIGKRDEQGKDGFSSGDNNLIQAKIKWKKCKSCKMSNYCWGHFPYFDEKDIKAFSKKLNINI